MLQRLQRLPTVGCSGTVCRGGAHGKVFTSPTDLLTPSGGILLTAPTMVSSVRAVVSSVRAVVSSVRAVVSSVRAVVSSVRAVVSSVRAVVSPQCYVRFHTAPNTNHLHTLTCPHLPVSIELWVQYTPHVLIHNACTGGSKTNLASSPYIPLSPCLQSVPTTLGLVW